ncbi:MAG: hypothetical protein RR382_00575 [Tannerellaceae bacterium]
MKTDITEEDLKQYINIVLDKDKDSVDKINALTEAGAIFNEELEEALATITNPSDRVGAALAYMNGASTTLGMGKFHTVRYKLTAQDDGESPVDIATLVVVTNFDDGAKADKDTNKCDTVAVGNILCNMACLLVSQVGREQFDAGAEVLCIRPEGSDKDADVTINI